MSVWDLTSNPLLATALDTSFGVKNISNQTYSLSFDVLFYYWQNQTGLTFEHQIIGTDVSSITHEVSANVSDANVGAALGLAGQYLRFQVPGKTVSYDAPNPIGKYEQSYIPLKQGSYSLVTVDDRIAINVTSGVFDWDLSNTIYIHVTYNGDPYANAPINITQKGTFTSQTYRAVTDQNGNAAINVYSNGPESGQLKITVTKDEFNHEQQTISYFVGASWIITIVLVAIAAIVLGIFLIQKRRKL
jgi:hypothetical protein